MRVTTVYLPSASSLKIQSYSRILITASELLSTTTSSLKKELSFRVWVEGDVSRPSSIVPSMVTPIRGVITGCKFILVHGSTSIRFEKVEKIIIVLLKKHSWL